MKKRKGVVLLFYRHIKKNKKNNNFRKTLKKYIKVQRITENKR